MHHCMLEFDTPECDEGHDTVEMDFTESYKLIGHNHWRYACPGCGQVIEISETREGGLEEKTLRQPGNKVINDNTFMSPVKE